MLAFCYPSLVIIDFALALKCLVGLLIAAIILFLLDKYIFELDIEFCDNVIKVKTMKSEDVFNKSDIESVFVEFNTTAEMKSKIQFVIKNKDTKTYFFSDKCYMSNTYKILENMQLFPCLKHDVIGIMPVREIAIDYYLANTKKMSFLKSYLAALENFHPIKKILFFGMFIFSALAIILGLILILVGVFLLQSAG